MLACISPMVSRDISGFMAQTSLSICLIFQPLQLYRLMARGDLARIHASHSGEMLMWSFLLGRNDCPGNGIVYAKVCWKRNDKSVKVEI